MADTISSKPVADSVAKINDEIAVGENLHFQRRWWRFERGVWIVFVLVIVLDAAGVFGRGPVARAHMRSDDGTMEVGYERIQRTGTPSLMTIRFGSGAIRDGEIRLYVSDSLLNRLGAQRISPQPAASVIGEGGVTYTFPANGPAGIVRIELQPAQFGYFSLELKTGEAARLQAHVFVMP